MLIRTRRFPWYNHKGEKNFMTVQYRLYYSGGLLVDIVNEFGFSVEKKSECWEFFNRPAKK